MAMVLSAAVDGAGGAVRCDGLLVQAKKVVVKKIFHGHTATTVHEFIR
jgi:hypothetical protein